MMNTNNFDSYIGKNVLVKGSEGSLDVTCKLEGYSEFGVILTAAEKTHGSTFRNRFYPWNRIDYIDLDIDATRASRVA